MRNFNEWLDKMRPSINGYNYYVDFDKVYANVDAIKVELNINQIFLKKHMNQLNNYVQKLHILNYLHFRGIVIPLNTP